MKKNTEVLKRLKRLETIFYILNYNYVNDPEFNIKDNLGFTDESKLLITQVELLLLNEQPEAITEDAQFRKHDVRRSVASESDQVIGDSGADSSETADVDGHEQTKEFCDSCGMELIPCGIYVKCPHCGEC